MKRTKSVLISLCAIICMTAWSELPARDIDQEGKNNVLSMKQVEADLRIEKFVDDTDGLYPMIGDTVVFTIRAHNYGPDDAPEVKITDNLPGGYSFVDAFVDDVSVGDLNDAGDTWTYIIDNLEADTDKGVVVTIEFHARVEYDPVGISEDPENYYVNHVVIGPADPADPQFTDPTDIDNEDTAETFPDLDVELNVSIVTEEHDYSPLQDTEAVFTISVQNLGTGHATGVVVYTTLPDGYVFKSSDPEVNSKEDQLEWTIGDLKKAEAAYIDVIAEVLQSTSAQQYEYDYTVYATADQDDEIFEGAVAINPVCSPEANQVNVEIDYRGRTRVNVMGDAWIFEDGGANNALDPAQVEIVEMPASGADATVNADGTITIDYSFLYEFTGEDHFDFEITNFGGLSDISTVYITVNLEEIIVPNSFSPNNNGFNDFWVIPDVNKFPENKLVVYNRYGNIVYEMEDYDNSWDGTYKDTGNDLPSGTYFYTLELGNDNGVKKGTVYITR